MIATSLLLLWIGFCFRATAESMVSIWSRSETFTHGFFIAPISLWLIWRRREQLRIATPTTSPIWMLPLALLGVCWWVGDMIGANVVVQFSFVGMLIAAVFFMLGWTVARIILFPLLFLLFAVPFGEFLLPLLIEKTADITVFALRLTGVPVYREGNSFLIPSGAWSVVEACSGVRYLIASVVVGALFAYLNYRSWQRRAVFVAVSIVVPILANWVRAYLIVMLGHLSGNRIATGVDHVIYGWLFFGIVISILFAIGARWYEPERVPAPEPSTHAAPVARPPALRWIGVGVVAAWVTLPPLAARIATGGVPEPARLSYPAPAGGHWQAMAAPPASFGAVDHSPLAAGLVVYRQDPWQVGVALTNASAARPSVPLGDVRPSLHVPAANAGAGTTQVELRCADRSVAAQAVDLRGSAAFAPAQSPDTLVVWHVQWDEGFMQALPDRWQRLRHALLRLRGKVNTSAALSLIATRNEAPTALKMFFEENCVAIDTYLRQWRGARQAAL